IPGLEGALGRVATSGRPAAGTPRPGALLRRNGSAALPECPACGESTRPSALLYRGARHRQCEACGSSLASELPSALDLQRHYETEYPRRFAPESVTSERAGLFRSLLDRLAALGLARTERPRLLSSLGPLVRSREWDTYPIVHHFAFTPVGLRRLVERAGFRVLEVGNSLPALGTHRVTPHAAAALSRWGRTAITAGVAVLAGL